MKSEDVIMQAKLRRKNGTKNKNGKTNEMKRHGTTWNDTERYETTRNDMTRHEMTQNETEIFKSTYVLVWKKIKTAENETKRHKTKRNDTTRNETTRHDTTWNDTKNPENWNKKMAEPEIWNDNKYRNHSSVVWTANFNVLFHSNVVRYPYTTVLNTAFLDFLQTALSLFFWIHWCESTETTKKKQASNTRQMM